MLTLVETCTQLRKKERKKAAAIAKLTSGINKCHLHWQYGIKTYTTWKKFSSKPPKT